MTRATCSDAFVSARRQHGRVVGRERALLHDLERTELLHRLVVKLASPAPPLLLRRADRQLQADRSRSRAPVAIADAAAVAKDVEHKLVVAAELLAVNGVEGDQDALAHPALAHRDDQGRLRVDPAPGEPAHLVTVEAGSPLPERTASSMGEPVAA